uniref:Uncharacterized protein n=1 Tax=Ornithorhynchus anatinus TaxID=9258 RepID=F7DM59_ORNAN
MAAMDLAKCLREELTCSVCMEYFIEPVTIGCGHSFCRICLLRCSADVQTSFSCPECLGVCQLKDLEINKRLGRLAVIGKQLGPHLLRGPAEEKELCERHQQSLKLFCQEDDTTICVSCYRSKEHGEHSERFQELLHPLWAEIEEVQTVLAAEKNEFSSGEGKKCPQNLVSDFEKMHRFLDEELELRLRSLEKNERETLQKLRQSKAHLFQQSRSHRAGGEVILYDQLFALSRSVLVLQQWPKATTSLELTACWIPGMREILSRYAVDMTLDPNIASPHLIVSQDRKSVTFVEAPQDVPDHQDRFDNCGSVLGAPVFTSGRHYWEVELGDKPEWEVAVCYESMSRKNNVPVAPGDIFSLMAFQPLSGASFWIAFPFTQLTMALPIRRVGVFLDYEAGVISFYNVSEKCLIHSSPPVRFSGPLRPVFSPCLTFEGRNAGPLIIGRVCEQHLLNQDLD